MEQRRILYTQPTIEASTKLHPEVPLAASWCVRTHGLLIEPPHLSRRGRRSAINTFLNDRNVDSTALPYLICEQFVEHCQPSILQRIQPSSCLHFSRDSRVHSLVPLVRDLRLSSAAMSLE